MWRQGARRLVVWERELLSSQDLSAEGVGVRRDDNQSIAHDGPGDGAENPAVPQPQKGDRCPVRVRSPQRLLLLATSAKIGGMAQVVVTLAGALQTRGWVVRTVF